LNDERVFLCNVVVTHHGHFFQSSKHASQHWKLVEEMLI
jgi:hypothetical protein